ncbi:MAG TPA: metal-dependent hydrolase, partial [Chloroflexi bacterium]|nr:metal-dependent hydrolase [Chloroflexota bacterium]
LSGNPSTKTKPDDVNPDYILITHGHGDHLGDSIEIIKRTGAKVIANAEVAKWLAQQAGGEVHAQHIGGGYHHPFGYLKLTQAIHGSSLPDGSYGGMPGGFLITTPQDEKLYFAGDTGLFAGMALIGEEGIDLAVLPIGDNYTMGPDDALRAVKMIQPKVVIPAHYNTWPLIEQDPAAWKKRVEEETNTQVRIMEPDTTLEF